MKWLTAGLMLVCCSFLQAQDVVVRNGFFADSLTVGDETGFYLSAKYPSNLNIIFPDSTFNYNPFEFNRREYFPTKTNDGTSYDSVIYYLSTFEVEPIQPLSLPVFQLNAQDCTTYNSNADTILLAALAKNIPDTLSAQNLPLRENTIYEDVPYLFNYPILFIVVGILVVVVVFVWIFFGKKIRKHFKLKKMFKAHQRFLDMYNKQIDMIRAAFSPRSKEM